jgi:hypothetical protein
MHIAIKFHNDPHLIAIEVDDVFVNWNLSPKLQPMRLTIAQHAPR